MLCFDLLCDADVLPQDPAAADLLAHISCDPTDPSASPADVQAAVQEYERLLGQPHDPSKAAAAGASKGRANKRQKKAAEGAEADTGGSSQVPKDVLPQVCQLYCGYLQERLQALAGQEEHALAAAAVAQQLFKLLHSAHAAGAADEELYAQWVQLATQLQQQKVRTDSLKPCSCSQLLKNHK